MDVSHAGEYITLGRIKNPILTHLLSQSQERFQPLSRNRSCEAILIDGKQSGVKMIAGSEEVKSAISKSVPMIISQPSSSEMEAITGIGVSQCEVAVIIPQKKGIEFDIYTFKSKDEYRRLGQSNRVESYSSTIRRIIGTNHRPYRNGTSNPNPEQKGEEKAALAGLQNVDKQERHRVDAAIDNDEEMSRHRRWYVLDADAYCWGKQRAFIGNGFQYDLVYVANVKPERKYLIMRTIGLGVSSGEKLQHNHRLHRGYFQSRVDISISGYGHDGWAGEGLFLESYAPQSLNKQNQDQKTLGIDVGFNVIAGVGFMGNSGVNNTGAQVGLTVYDQRSVASTYDDYSVTFESTAATEKWSFWLSGAEGAPIRKKNQKRDLLCRKFFLFDTIRDLPQLATGSVLQPDVQAVYFTSGDQQGKWTVTGTTEQHLLDVRSWILFGTSRKKSESVKGTVTIDFSKVGDASE